MTKKEFEKEVKKVVDRNKKVAKRKKGKKKPTIKEIREHLRKIVAYHKHEVNEGIPSIYPILGPANTDSDSSSEDEKRLHTKEELKKY